MVIQQNTADSFQPVLFHLVRILFSFMLQNTQIGTTQLLKWGPKEKIC